MRILCYRDLKVWQRAMDLAVESHRITRRLPSSERFALANQIRRSAMSVPANIAEGHSRHHRDDFLRFLSIARGSLAELESHLLIAAHLGYIEGVDLAPLITKASEVSRMLAGLVRALRRSRRGEGRAARKARP